MCVDPNLMAIMFVRALVLGTDPVENSKHEIAPCPVVVWEDIYTIDDNPPKKREHEC